MSDIAPSIYFVNQSVTADLFRSGKVSQQIYKQMLWLLIERSIDANFAFFLNFKAWGVKRAVLHGCPWSRYRKLLFFMVGSHAVRRVEVRKLPNKNEWERNPCQRGGAIKKRRSMNENANVYQQKVSSDNCRKKMAASSNRRALKAPVGNVAEVVRFNQLWNPPRVSPCDAHSRGIDLALAVKRNSVDSS